MVTEGEKGGDHDSDSASDCHDSQSESESVFANYKKTSNNKTTIEPIVKVMNNYKYCGTNSDYDNLKVKKENENLEISFTKYKEMIKNKNE